VRQKTKNKAVLGVFLALGLLMGAATAGPARAHHKPGHGATTSTTQAPTTSTTQVVTTTTQAPTTTTQVPGQRFLIGPLSEIMSLPTSGTAWNALVADAGLALSPNLANQDNQSAAHAVAAGLVYVRTGNTAYRDKVVTALRAIVGTEDDTGSRTLSVGRQMAGWVIAADLVGYRDPSFVTWVGNLRTFVIGGHTRWTTLQNTHETTSSNWGAFAGASRIAMDLYIGDMTDLTTAVQVFKGALGDRSSWPTLPVNGSGQGFLPTMDFDPAWACQYPAWQPLNGPCTGRGGALVEDISRSAGTYPTVDSTGTNYSWEALQGLTLQAVLLANNGYPDVWTWQNNALRRSLEFLQDINGFSSTNMHSINWWVPHVVNQAYGTAFPVNSPAGNGRNFGYTDWLQVAN
jgi:hypothetical protein